MLDHVVSENGIEPDPEKIKALITLAPPTETRQLHTFLQKVKYLSRFISMLSQVLYPLQQVVKKMPLQWTSECGEVFEAVKEIVGRVSSIKAPDFNKTFYVNPSVGPDALGAILLQQGEQSRYMRPVFFPSRVKSEAEKRYSAAESVLASFVFACKRFRNYLLPHSFVVLYSFATTFEWY